MLTRYVSFNTELEPKHDNEVWRADEIMLIAQISNQYNIKPLEVIAILDKTTINEPYKVELGGVNYLVWSE